MKRLFRFKPMLLLPLLAVFASLQFSGPNGEPINSVLDPLLPAKADAACFVNTKCAQSQYGYFCTGATGWHCWLNPDATNCWEATGSNCP